MIKCLPRDVMERMERRFVLLYGAARARTCLERLAMLVGRYGVGYEPCPPIPGWSEKDALLIAYGDMVRSTSGETPLKTLKGFLDRNLNGVTTWVHLLPFFPYSSDDGFSVIHYRNVDSALGGWDDIRALGEHFRLFFDLVLNHMSRQSAWFQDYVQGIDPAAHYFIEADPAADLRAVARPRSLPLLTPVRTRAGEKHLWTTFSSDQLDLNYANPDVLFEFLDLMLFYIMQGAGGLRLDAVAYLWKQIGTACIHLPETHAIVKIFRDLAEIIAPGFLLLTETNVPHRENIEYFGNGDEARLVYQFSLPPLLLHALLSGDASRLTRWAAALESPPAGCTFLNFTASHDGIGVRPLHGLLSDEELDRLVDGVRRRGGTVSTRATPGGRDEPYELNISYFDALSFPDQPASPLHVDRFLCSQMVPLALRGVPAFYFNSLVAAPNDTAEWTRTGQARSLNRKKWNDRELESLLGAEHAPAARVLRELKARLKCRAGHAAFHPDGHQRVVDAGPETFLVERTSPDGRDIVLCVHNMTDHAVANPATAEMTDLFTGRRVAAGEAMKPYSSLWLG